MGADNDIEARVDSIIEQLYESGADNSTVAAPYTHWMKLGAPLPAAPRHETGEGL